MCAGSDDVSLWEVEHTVIRDGERLPWPHDGRGMLRGCFLFLYFLLLSSTSAPTHHLPHPAQTPPPPRSRVGPPGSYVTCIRILPSGITKATSSQLQLIVSLIDYAADYLCDSLVSFQLCNKIVKKKKKNAVHCRWYCVYGDVKQRKDTDAQMFCTSPWYIADERGLSFSRRDHELINLSKVCVRVISPVSEGP